MVETLESYPTFNRIDESALNISITVALDKDMLVATLVAVTDDMATDV